MSEMAKIVYNGCFGGFGLSKAAQAAYAKRKGFEVFFYQQTAYKHREGRDEYRKVGTGVEESVFGFTLKTDLGEVATSAQLNAAEWFHDHEIPRNDPDLVAIVEEMGDKASGSCARLKIAEVSKGSLYRIDEYDGNESVMTNSDYDWQVA